MTHDNAWRINGERNFSVDWVGDPDIRIAVSIGVACKEFGMVDAETMVNAADRALYEAKHGGRNQTCLFKHNQVVCPHGKAALVIYFLSGIR